MNMSHLLDHCIIETAQGKILKSEESGYPIFYIDAENNALCTICALQQALGDFPKEKIIGMMVNWEHDCLYCDSCANQIEPAYSDPD